MCRAMLQHWPFTPELAWKLRYWLPYVEPLSWKKNGARDSLYQGRAELGEPSFHSFFSIVLLCFFLVNKNWSHLWTLDRNPDATRLEKQCLRIARRCI